MNRTLFLFVLTDLTAYPADTSPPKATHIMLRLIRSFLYLSCIVYAHSLYAQNLQFTGAQSVTGGQITAGIATNTSSAVSNVYTTVSNASGGPALWNVQWNSDGSANVVSVNTISSHSTWQVNAQGNFEIVSAGGSVSTDSVTTFDFTLVMNAPGTATVYLRYSIPIMTQNGLVNRQGQIPIGTVKKSEPGVYYSPSTNTTSGVPTIGISTTDGPGQWVPVSIDQTTVTWFDNGGCEVDVTSVSVMVYVATASVTSKNLL